MVLFCSYMLSSDHATFLLVFSEMDFLSFGPSQKILMLTHRPRYMLSLYGYNSRPVNPLPVFQVTFKVRGLQKFIKGSKFSYSTTQWIGSGSQLSWVFNLRTHFYLKLCPNTTSILITYLPLITFPSCFQWDGSPIVQMGWSITEDLLCVAADGSVLVYDIHGAIKKTLSMGQVSCL